MQNRSLELQNVLNKKEDNVVYIKVQNESSKKSGKVIVDNSFYMKQYNKMLIFYLLSLVFWVGFLSSSLAYGLFLYSRGQPMAYWVMLFVVSVFSFFSLSLTIVKLISFVKDFNKKSFPDDNKVVIPSLNRIYRKMSVASVNQFWLLGALALYAGIFIGGSYFVAWFYNLFSYNKAPLGELILAGDNKILLNISYGIYILLGALFIFVFTGHILRQSMISQIDNFYGFELVPYAQIDEIRRYNSKRNRNMLIISLILVFIGFYLIYRFIRKNKR